MRIYLAIPYTGIEKESFKTANFIAGRLMELGHAVFSPISMTHPIAVENRLNEPLSFWLRNDKEFIPWCDYLFVVTLEGYKKSKGVNAEIKIAKEFGKPIKYIEV